MRVSGESRRCSEEGLTSACRRSGLKTFRAWSLQRKFLMSYSPPEVDRFWGVWGS